MHLSEEDLGVSCDETSSSRSLLKTRDVARFGTDDPLQHVAHFEGPAEFSPPTRRKWRSICRWRTLAESTASVSMVRLPDDCLAERRDKFNWCNY
jgi:hypothetical protein